MTIEGVHYTAHYCNGPDDNSIFHLYFKDQAQADAACDKLEGANDGIVCFETLYGKASINLNYNFVGLFPDNNSSSEIETDKAGAQRYRGRYDLSADEAQVLVELAPADDDECDDMTPEECEQRKEEQRRWDYEAGGRAN